MKKSNGQTVALLGLMDSLADETRLRLLRLLDGNELGVVDLCDVLQMPQSTVSRHLKVLTDQGWTRSRREGTTNRYSMTEKDLTEAARQLWQLARTQTDDWSTVRQDALRLEHRLRQRQSDTKAFFAGAAGSWEKLRRELYGDEFTTAALLALLPGDWRVADLGCGTGQLIEQLAENVTAVIGVDNSPEMLEAAATRLKPFKNVELRAGDLEALPIDDLTCDAALLVLVLTYVEEPALVLGELARVLKPGGRAVIVDLLSHDREDFRRDMGQRWPGFDPADLTDAMTVAGLAGAQCRALPPQPEATGPALIMATGKKGEASE